MPKLPPVSGKLAIKAFIKIGYQVSRKRGSHVRLHHEDEDRNPLSIPDHKVLGRGLLKRLLRDAEISTEEFLKILKR